MRLFSMIVLAVALWSGGTCRASQPASLPAAGSVGASSGSHGWTVIRADSMVPWALVHIPPRSAGGAGGSAEDGASRIAAALGSEPVAMAAINDRVYMAFAEDTLGGNGMRRVLGVRSVRNPVSNLWQTEPPGRFDAFPSLPAEGKLHDLCGLNVGPLAVLTAPAPGGDALTLKVLLDDRWIDVAPPADAASPRHDIRWSAFASGEGCVLLGRRGGTIEMWRTSTVLPLPSPIDAARVATAHPVSTIDLAPIFNLSPEWQERQIISSPLAFQSEAGADWPMVWHAEELICAIGVGTAVDSGVGSGASGQSVRFVAWRGPDEWRDVAQIDGVGERIAVLPLHDCGRIVALWTTPKSGETSGLMSGRVPLERSIREISMATGRTMYGGSLKLAGPVSASDYRFVMLSLLMVSATVLLFVLRPEDTIAFQLPTGLALAQPARRMLATIIDFVIVILIVWQATGHPASEIGSMEAWREHGTSVFFVALAAACIVNTLLEGLTGFTLGKRLLGCRVVGGISSVEGPANADADQTEAPPPPGLGRALIRNAVKWGLPPLAVLGLIDPEGRGRGDQLARTAVAVAIPPDEPVD